MLGKLFKYEFKSEGRILFPIFGATVLISVLSAIFSNMLGPKGAPLTILRVFSVCLIIIFVLLVIASILMSAIAAVLRFKNSMLSTEGYLTHTLPVKPISNISSKLLSSVIFVIMSAIAALISVFMFFLIISGGKAFDFKELSHLIEAIANDIGFPNITGYIIEGIILAIITSARIIAMCYASLSIGHSFNSGKIIKSVGVFIGFYLISQIINSSLILPLNLQNYIPQNEYCATHIMFICVTVLQAIYLAIYLVITNYFIKNKLNLE